MSKSLDNWIDFLGFSGWDGLVVHSKITNEWFEDRRDCYPTLLLPNSLKSFYFNTDNKNELQLCEVALNFLKSSGFQCISWKIPNNFIEPRKPNQYSTPKGREIYVKKINSNFFTISNLFTIIFKLALYFIALCVLIFIIVSPFVFPSDFTIWVIILPIFGCLGVMGGIYQLYDSDWGIDNEIFIKKSKYIEYTESEYKELEINARNEYERKLSEYHTDMIEYEKSKKNYEIQKKIIVENIIANSKSTKFQNKKCKKHTRLIMI